jgi:FixJ family two-component response regulator
MSDGPESVPPQLFVAIVDDEESVRISLLRLCEALGLRAAAYASGGDFLASLRGDEPRADCLLLDAHMPLMTGAELQRDLVARGVRIPTIVYSADDPGNMAAHYTAGGTVSFLRKPAGAEELLRAIEQAARGSGSSVGPVVSD